MRNHRRCVVTLLSALVLCAAAPGLARRVDLEFDPARFDRKPLVDVSLLSPMRTSADDAVVQGQDLAPGQADACVATSAVPGDAMPGSYAQDSDPGAAKLPGLVLVQERAAAVHEPIRF